jgi:hypothetical protein
MEIQNRLLNLIMNRKKGGNNMQRNYIHVEKEAEYSYSFLFGDQLRQMIVSPWKIPFLPFSVVKGVTTHRKKRIISESSQSIVDCIFVYDLEKMRLSDQKSFVNQSMNYSSNSIGIGIGNPAVNSDYKHIIPTRKMLDIKPREWNKMLENFLLGVIRAYRPKKFVFIGKYPYASLMAVLRKCEPKEGFFWIHIRGDVDVIEERSPKFNSTRELSYFTDHDAIVRNTIYFDEDPPEHLKLSLKQSGISIIQAKNHAEYVSLNKGDFEYKEMLMRNQTLFVHPENQIDLGHLPDYLLTNLIISDLTKRAEIIDSVIAFRKRLGGKKSPLMSVEAKLDLWLKQAISD